MPMSKLFDALEGISLVAHQTSENKIENIMAVREFIIFCVINHHSGSPITIGNLTCVTYMHVKAVLV